MRERDRREPDRPEGGDRPQRTHDRRANKVILQRSIFLMAVCGVLMFLPLIWTLWQICIVQHDYYQELAVRQQTRDVEVSAMRGDILDRNGNVLAMSATVYNLILSPRDVINSVDEKDYQNEDGVTDQTLYQAAVAAKKAAIVDGLCAVLPQLDRADVEERMGRDSAYQILARDLEREDSTAVREYISENKLSACVYLTPSSKRYYPYSSLAAQVVGFVNDNGGAYGVEALYDEELSGTVGRVVTAKANNGTEMPNGWSNYVDASDGSDVTLTIDVNIQQFAEQAVQQGIEAYNAQGGGICIVMDPDTGAILAHVSVPTYDLNQPGAVIDKSLSASLEALRGDPAGTDEAYDQAVSDARFQQWRSKVVNDTYEPGSTFKAVVLAAALEEGVVSESDTFYCPGYTVVNGTRIACSDTSGHGSQTLREAVQNSCNPAFIEIGQRLGAEKFYEYFETFGMTEVTGVDLIGETKGLAWTEDYFTSAEGYLSLATASFGQRFTTTPIRMITAFAATINGGYLYQPYVVDRISDSEGNLIRQTEPTVVRQTVSEATSAHASEILESVVSEGTGGNAYVEGYRVGGKTGTSQTLVGEHDYIVSFMGFAPADDPEVIVLLALYYPEWSHGMYSTSGTYISGGQMAAPLVGQVIEETLEYMGVEREYTAEEANAADVEVPQLVGLSAADAKTRLERAGLGCRTVGDGDTVTGQIPARGTSIPGESQVVLYLGEEMPTEPVTVPDVTGKTLEGARAALAEAGLYMRASGVSTYYTSSTLAIDQSVQGGETAAPGTVIEVRFANNNVYD